MSKVAIIGAGLVGRAWAIALARAGHQVEVFDSEPGAVQRALAFADAVLGDLDANDLLGGMAPQVVRERIRQASSLEDAVDGTIHVQEGVPEILDIKRALFARLDEIVDSDTILASSTSALLLRRRSRPTVAL